MDKFVEETSKTSENDFIRSMVREAIETDPEEIVPIKGSDVVDYKQNTNQHDDEIKISAIASMIKKVKNAAMNNDDLILKHIRKLLNRRRLTTKEKETYKKIHYKIISNDRNVSSPTKKEIDMYKQLKNTRLITDRQIASQQLYRNLGEITIVGNAYTSLKNKLPSSYTTKVKISVQAQDVLQITES